MVKLHIWTEEEKEYLKEITPGHHYREIQNLMNEKFSFTFSLDQIKSAINRYKLNTGFNGQFSKENKPWNKDLKGIQTGGKETQFKKGNKPVNYMPVGSERVNGDGYVDIKTADPNKWKGKHILKWEKENGPVPKGHCVIFGDMNNRNFNMDNLILVSRYQLLVMNKKKLIKNDAELTKTGAIIADLQIKMSERGRAK